MTKSADTHCPYCALQCAMTLTSPAELTPASEPGSVPVPAEAAVPGTFEAPLLDVQGRDFPTNRGGLCRKGWTSATLLNHAGRVTEPLLKGADGIHRPIGWDQALALVTTAVKDTQARYGKDAVGVFGGGGLTNEKAYMLGKFARLALGTSRIDYNGRFCMSSAAAAGMRAFGVDRGLPFPLTDLDTASTILMLGSNVAETMPPFVQHLQGARDAGGLIVVDPRRSATAKFTADGGGLHLQPLPGTDLTLLLGLSHVIIHEGLADEDFIAARTTGYEAVVRSVNAFWPERVQSITGVPAELIRETARRLADGARKGGSYILTGRGVEQHVDGTDTATAAINLSLLLGLPGSRPQRLRHAHRPGQRPGRAGTRPEGRPAPRLPQDHRSRRPRPHGRRLGRPGGNHSRPRPPRRPAAEVTGTARRRAVPSCARLQYRGGLPRRERRHRRAPQPGLPGGLRLLYVRDRRRGRPHPAGPAVGRGRRHTDQPRGACPAPPPGHPASRRRPQRAVDHGPAGRGPRGALHATARTRKRCSRSCASPLPADWPTTPASTTPCWTAARRPTGPTPQAAPARRGSSWTPLRTPTERRS